MCIECYVYSIIADSSKLVPVSSKQHSNIWRLRLQLRSSYCSLVRRWQPEVGVGCMPAGSKVVWLFRLRRFPGHNPGCSPCSYSCYCCSPCSCLRCHCNRRCRCNLCSCCSPRCYCTSLSNKYCKNLLTNHFYHRLSYLINIKY